MNFSFENQGTNTYLVYNIQKEDKLDTMSLGMLTNNKIPGLASTIFTQMDEKKYVKYNVSAKVSVKQFFTGSVNKKRLLGVFSGIVNAMLSAEDYMIDPNAIMLDLDYIFADVSTCETVLVCLPIESKAENSVNLGMFFKNIMFSTQFDQTENCDHVAKIINFLNSTPSFSLADFKALLDSIIGVQSSVSVQQNQPEPVRGNTAASNQGQPMASNFQQPGAVAPQAPQSKASSLPAGGSVQPKPNSQAQAQNFAINNAVPPKQGQPMSNMGQNINKNENSANAPQKNMSLGKLLMHYNKENKQLYKEQKAAKKAQKQSKSSQNNPQKNVPNNGFAVPGQQPSIGNSTPVVNQNMNSQNKGFATPAQQSIPQNKGFATPAQQPIPQNKGFATPAQQPIPQNKGFATPAQQPIPQNKGFATPTNNSMPNRNNSTFAAPMQPSQSNMVNGADTMSQASAIPVSNVGATPMPQTAQSIIPQQSPNFGETTVLGTGAIGETTVLNVNQQPNQNTKPFLIRTKTGEKIVIDKIIYRIGKEKSYVDYFIGDNTAISRGHANILAREGKYYIIDTNSTNHTFVNEKMIQSNVETLLEHGTMIRLANEEFEFKLY